MPPSDQTSDLYVTVCERLQRVPTLTFIEVANVTDFDLHRRQPTCISPPPAPLPCTFLCCPQGNILLKASPEGTRGFVAKVRSTVGWGPQGHTSISPQVHRSTPHRSDFPSTGTLQRNSEGSISGGDTDDVRDHLRESERESSAIFRRFPVSQKLSRLAIFQRFPV